MTRYQWMPSAFFSLWMVQTQPSGSTNQYAEFSVASLRRRTFPLMTFP